MTERMGVLSSDGRCLQPSPLAARAMLRPAARRLAAVGIGFAGGWAVLYGALMPFGLGLTLGLAEDCFAPCAAGAALGLLLHGLGALSLRSLCQLCALGAAVAARWLLPQKFVPAALAGCGTLTGMALCFALGSSGGADLLLYSAADALLAAGIGFGLRRFAPERPGMGTLLVGAAVAAALALKSEDESGATLDLISVDLYTGTARLFKAGAAPGFLVHGGGVRAVGEATLPMGVLGGVNGQSRVVHLTAGDYAVLVSDGLLVDGAGWVAKQVELSAAAGDAPEKLAETLVQTARIRAQKTGRPDDITAAVLRLEKSG